MQEVLGCFQERLAYSEEPMEDLAGEREVKKKCTKCGEVKSLKNYYKDKRRTRGRAHCKECEREWLIEYRNTEIGYLKQRYNNMRRNFKTHRGRYNKRYFTFDEFHAAFEKHKNIYGCRCDKKHKKKN